MSNSKILQSIEENFLSPSPEKIRKVLREAIKKNMAPDAALKALTQGMERARQRFQDKTSPLPELLLSVDAFREGLKLLTPHLAKTSTLQKQLVIVIGVVEGDVHDLGKNVVAGILEVSGYAVHDLGRDVPGDVFLDAVRKKRADVLALSSMMSTPLDNMREVIRWARKLHPGIRIVVGGAALDEALAAKMGADGYAENAGGASEEVRRVLQGRPAVKRAVRG